MEKQVFFLNMFPDYAPPEALQSLLSQAAIELIVQLDGLKAEDEEIRAAEEIIADIEAGIKKEVSVGCAMGLAVCSVCGGEYGTCGHQKGEHYDGQLCCVILREPMDAYEFSFVAVPAQRDAGVIKGMGGSGRCLKELADEFGAQSEYRTLYKQAQLGRHYEKLLQDEVVRLILSLDMGLEEPTARSIASKIGAEELQKLKEALESRVSEYLPLQTQLRYHAGRPENVETGFLI